MQESRGPLADGRTGWLEAHRSGFCQPPYTPLTCGNEFGFGVSPW